MGDKAGVSQQSEVIDQLKEERDLTNKQAGED
jgi:hypothetical protein